jgi:ABC-2 type transport system ATP-binding protein
MLREKLSIESELLDATLRIERPRAHELVPQLIEALPGMVRSVSVGKPTLEDVFIDLTGRHFLAADHAGSNPSPPHG